MMLIIYFSVLVQSLAAHAGGGGGECVGSGAQDRLRVMLDTGGYRCREISKDYVRKSVKEVYERLHSECRRENSPDLSIRTVEQLDEWDCPVRVVSTDFATIQTACEPNDILPLLSDVFGKKSAYSRGDCRMFEGKVFCRKEAWTHGRSAEWIESFMFKSRGSTAPCAYEYRYVYHP